MEVGEVTEVTEAGAVTEGVMVDGAVTEGAMVVGEKAGDIGVELQLPADDKWTIRRFLQQLVFLCDGNYRNSCCSMVNFCQRLLQSVQDYLNLGNFSKNILNIIRCSVFFLLTFEANVIN